MSNIRVRFAPSPTGALHMGGARTALFNWLFARQNGGKFILRIEDTDFRRSREDSAQGIVEGLSWLGLDWDEGPDIGGPLGPYRQSERGDIYSRYLQELLDSGQAYYCFCSPEDLQKEREEAAQEKRDYKYGGRCKALKPEEASEMLQAGKPAVIRLKVPLDGNTVVPDLIRGDVSFSNALFDDFIIAKSDGWPTYNFAVVVDDFSMQISHVLRAEEHLSNTPRQLLIYRALGLKEPAFAHLSMILAPDRSKLSKRHGAISVQEFENQGYLPEALVNYLALLGWSTGKDIDIWSREEMMREFSLEHISKSPAIYDLEKLAWMNGQYMMRLDIESLMALVEPQAQQQGWLNEDNFDYFQQAVELVRNRAKTRDELLDALGYFFEEVKQYDEKGVKKHFGQQKASTMLSEVLEIVSNMGSFSAAELEEAFRQRAQELKIKAADLIHPTRLALSGRTATPGLFELMEVLGQEKCISRLEKALDFIAKLTTHGPEGHNHR
ncbi:glutamate--tRNA ligase [Syntrophomonas wolfei]|uniref:Glutamate--tRNA ligase 1 n=1 Tax=Syntrophomonas wolfei subsp. wolfei (strain DSM 2245B / Goettingen) TaxID=335541 RepID=SYE1_SYNWW|nr:glutamate--tRNA ligase [Syntrophomonas wolfei]Q0AYF8.1 RecName: Full=Glutamate--tRNA ligase 1; AltName: Full=Glutamyl-tRNA synthetase 1; Short=GluRS 1 [Syntrophomonas wolfei subsp. wolfei str. Goettingen G311]ABI68246.1 glutamyl-tRNA synthetase [Syntrophomonas wolfei subsp. wolfei str. Goettingen G311]